MSDKRNKALDFLRDKYGAAAGKIVGNELVLADGAKVELLPHRVERRFVELKNLVVNRTLEDVSTLRFASFSAGGDLEKMLARELDLAAWLTDSAIVRLFAVGAGKAAYNVIAKLANDMNVAIEVSNKLPAGTAPIDRHELIAHRGVASDRVVDSQVPQASIYAYTANGECCFTDVDEELFELSTDEIWQVRAAFAVLTKPEWGAAWNAAAARVRTQCAAVFASDLQKQPVSC